MPKIPLPELEAAAEYLTGKVPRYGMFSTLKGLIDNSPRDVMTAQEWGGYLKPGQVATRAGVEFPLKKEELDYSKIPDFLASYKPNEKLHRDQILGQYMTEAPDLNADIGSKQAKQGQTREQQLLGQQDMSIEDRLKRLKGTRGPQYSEYSHAQRGDSPGNAASPFGDDLYQLDITTSPDFGRFQSHWDGNDLSWSRTNRLPLAGENLDYDPGNPGGGPRTMRVIDEIQSDRHQKAIKPGGWRPAPEDLVRMQNLGSDLMNIPGEGRDTPYGRNTILEALRYGPENVRGAEGLATDPRWVQLQQLREASKGKLGYAGDAEKQRLAEIEQDPLYRNPTEAANRNQRAYFDAEGNMQTRTDPAIQTRLDALRQEHQRLSSMVPDTPFKTTQGYVGLEMRKALADAVHSGDLGLGLATGNDQNAFYMRRFNADQATGQNYNYNTSYPSILKDLAKRFQAPYRPMDVTLKAQPTTNPAWPPSGITRYIPDFGQPGEAYNLEGFINTINNLDRYNRYDRLRGYDRLWDEMRNKIPEEERTALGIRGVDPDTGEFIENPELAESKFKASIEDMRKHQREIEDLRNKFPEPNQEGEGHYDEDDNWVEDEPDAGKLQAHQDMLRSHTYRNAVYNFDQASKEAAQGLQPLYQWYEGKFGPAAIKPEDLLRQKTFQNTMDFSDPGVADRIKAAGVPVWRTGGSVNEGFDHVGHALRHIGHETGFLTHNAIEQGFAGGGEVGTFEHLAQLVGQFLEHMHNSMRLPPEQLTEDHIAKAADLSDQLRAAGIDPEEVINTTMARAGKGPGMQVTEHAEGGEVTVAPVGDLSNAPSSLETAVNWLKQHTPTHALLNPNAPMPDLPSDVSRTAKAVMEPFYGQDAEGHIRFLGGGPEFHIGKDGGASITMGRPMLADEIQTSIEGANKLLEKFGNWLHPPEKNLSTLITGPKKEEGPSEADTRLGNLKAAIANRTGIGAPQNFKQFLEDQAGVVIPIPGMQEEEGAMAAGRAAQKGTKAIGHVLAQFGITPMEEYAHVAPVWAGGNAGINYAMDKLSKMKAQQHAGSQGQMSPEDAVNNATLTQEELDPTGPREEPPDTRNPQDVVGEEQYQRYLRGNPEVDMMGSHGTGMADGGQPQEEAPPPTAPTEESLLNDMLQRRILMRQSAPPIPLPQMSAPLQMGGGGEVGMIERLAQLLSKLTSLGEDTGRLASRVPQAPRTAVGAATNPDMAAHTADIMGRDWTKTVQPQTMDIFQKFREQNPELASHADDIQNRDWTSIYDQGVPLPINKDDGGPVRNPGTRKAKVPQVAHTPNQIPTLNWGDVKRRLDILRNPLISGPPPTSIPPMPHALSNDEIDQRAAIERIRNMMGRDQALESGVESEDMGPMHFNSATDNDLMQAIQAKLLANKSMNAIKALDPSLTNEERLSALTEDAKEKGTYNEHALEKEAEDAVSSDTHDQTMRRGGHAKHHRAAGKVHGRMRARG